MRQQKPICASRGSSHGRVWHKANSERRRRHAMLTHSRPCWNAPQGASGGRGPPARTPARPGRQRGAAARRAWNRCARRSSTVPLRSALSVVSATLRGRPPRSAMKVCPVAARPARARVAQRAPAGRAASALCSRSGRRGRAHVRQAAEGEDGRVVRALLQLAARGRALLCILQDAGTGLTLSCRSLQTKPSSCNCDSLSGFARAHAWPPLAGL